MLRLMYGILSTNFHFDRNNVQKMSVEDEEKLEKVGQLSLHTTSFVLFKR